MNTFQNYLNLDESRHSLKVFLSLMVIAYLFSIATRMIWVDQFAGVENFQWNGQLMINTNDGYYYAEGARDILADAEHNGLSPMQSAPSVLTAFLVKLLPFSFETVILYMPAFLGALLVVPVMLIGRAIRQDTLGFVAALLAGIAWSYYNRTMTGYYDTDMLTIVLPTFVLWSVILAVMENRNRYLLIVTITMLAYQWWYGQSYSLNFAMIVIVLLYTLVFDRKNSYNYKLMLFMVIPNIAIPIVYKLALSIGLFAAFHKFKENITWQVVIGLLTTAIIAMLATGGFNPIWYSIKGYLLREETSALAGQSLHYFNVVQTVREAGQIPFETFANRISGHTITFILSVIGTLLLMFRYRVMLIALPLLGLGFLALFGGLRFTVYAVPVAALGIAYLILFAGKRIETVSSSKAARYAFIVFASALVLYPNIKHINEYMVPTVLDKSEVEVLTQLDTVSNADDYAIAWWDYGYPIRYYGGVKTLIDGAQHQGDANFPVSFALLQPQASSALMARLNVEYKEAQQGKQLNFIQDTMKAHGFEDPNLFLEYLALGDLTPPTKTRDIYFYLPMRMLQILPTVRLFSNIDLTTGKSKQPPFLYQTRQVQDMGNVMQLGGGFTLDKSTRSIVAAGQGTFPINTYAVVGYNKEGELVRNIQQLDPNAQMYVIYLDSFKTMLLMDKSIYDSTYIQLMFLEQYDPKLFEPVVLSPLAKIYKLKI